MTVTEEGRHRLHQALDRTIGPEEATTLMEHLPPVGWADVATKSDLAHLREHIDLRFDRERDRVDGQFALVDERFRSVDQRFEDVDRRFEQVDRRFEQVDRRFDEMMGRLDSIETRLTHQFWQFLTLMAAFGAIVIGILRFT